MKRKEIFWCLFMNLATVIQTILNGITNFGRKSKMYENMKFLF